MAFVGDVAFVLGFDLLRGGAVVGVVTTVLVAAASRNRCLAEESVIGGLSLLVALMSDKQLAVAIVDFGLWTMATDVLASLIDS